MSELEKVIEYVNEHHSGHFTLMKFTTNWRACYGTLTDYQGFIRCGIPQMKEGESQEVVLQKLLDDPIHVSDFIEISYEEWLERTM